MQYPGYTKAFAVTPHDTNAFNPGFTVKAVQVGTAGTLTVVPTGNAGVAVAFTLVAGQLLPVSVNRVKASGTTCTLVTVLGD